MYTRVGTREEVADIIERFLSGTERYPQEFNDFIDCGVADPKLDVYRKRCQILHTEFEPRRGEDPEQRAQREQGAKRELQSMIAELRSLGGRSW